MAFIRNCFIIAVCTFCVIYSDAQTVSYPIQSSQLLKSTAEDVAMLLQKAVSGGQFTTVAYSALPARGIILIYDSAITDNQACKIESDGIGVIKFSASQDNGLCFGIYHYLQNLGFRFYQPGYIWEITPSLTTAYEKIDTIYTFRFKYNSWFVSGGHTRWVMDNNTSYSWDTYFGENGHNWALYQRRNGMTGEYRFSGHRGDIMTGTYLNTLQNTPCYVASFNNSRVATNQSVPDVNNIDAMQLWSNTIEQKYTSYRNIILGDVNLYVNQFRNFNYGNHNMGIEVPDGARWGNTIDNLGCINSGYAKESDQQFTLADYTVRKIENHYPNLRFQLYAYSTHADVPSTNITINDKLDVQLIPAVYQNLTSANGLRNRWYNRIKNISEYNYLNISGWSGETPAFYLDDFKATLQIAKNKNSQGLVWEASPAKFASLPFLLAANRNLKDNISVDSTLQEFCDNMFVGAGKTIFTLLQLWSDSKCLAGGISNRYKIPLYLQMLSEADLQIQQEPAVVKDRMRELKAYLHYMVMYYDWVGDQRSNDAKTDKAAALCIYLAKTNKLQLVNSYYLITSITSKYPTSSNFYSQYNNINGLAYLNGNLPLITAAEIDNAYQNDKALYGNYVHDFRFESSSFIKNQFESANLNSLKKITVQISYTNGMDYYNRCEFFIKAPTAGSFTINYNPRFEMPDKGYINFTVESTDNVLEVIEDFSLGRNAKAGTLTINLPVAGNYKLSILSKYKSAVDLDISTNRNIFYKSNTFLGWATEFYQNNFSCLPGYFYIPKGMQKIYFSISNSNPGGSGFASEDKINNALAIQDNNGNIVRARFVTPNDSALFYFDIPSEKSGMFYKITKKGNYGVTFSNISNLLWYGEPKPRPCNNADFTVSAVNKNGNCITQLTAVSNASHLEWEVNDMGRTYTFSNQKVIQLPDYSSPNAIATLTNGINCTVTKRIGDDVKFLRAKEACASGAPIPEEGINPVIYPNPSTGIFNCMQNGNVITANEIMISNSHGGGILHLKNVKQFNIKNAPAGMYLYKIVVKGEVFNGKLVKL